MLSPNRQLKKLWEIVLEMSSGFACNKNYERLWWYVHLRTHNISIDWTLNFDLIVEIDPKKVDIKKNYIQKWDILFNNTNSKELVWKTALVDKNYPYAYSNHITKLQLKEGYSPKYIVFFLNYLWSRGYFQEKCNKWIWQAWFNNSMLKEIQIPLPPLEEQKKIVAYLDQLNATITKLKAEYQSQLTALGEMRNSSLDLAFWWSKEREREWNLNNWKWVKLWEVCEKIQYGFTWKTSDTGKYKYLRITDIQNNIVDWESVPFVEIEESEAPKFLLNTWEIVFARTGATVGKSFLIWEVGNNKIFASYLIRLIPQYKQVKSDFLKYFFQSRIYWNQILTDAIGAAQPNFNGKKLSLLELPLPDLETQAKIVAHLDQVHQHITSLKAQVDQQIQHCDELWQSRLEQALSQGVK